LVLALLHGVLGRLEPVVTERERHGAREVLDRADLLEDLLESGLLGHVLAARPGGGFHSLLPPVVAEQPGERPGLQGEQAGYLEGLVDPGEGDAGRAGSVSVR